MLHRSTRQLVFSTREQHLVLSVLVLIRLFLIHCACYTGQQDNWFSPPGSNIWSYRFGSQSFEDLSVEVVAVANVGGVSDVVGVASGVGVGNGKTGVDLADG